jgi:hypothetical protein
LAALAAEGLELPSLLRINSLVFEGVTIDVLHAVDAGVASHIIANVFVEIMHGWGANQAARTRVLEGKIKDFYNENKHSAKIQGKLTFERLKTSNDWPKLKAKAAATRHLAHFALELAVAEDLAVPADADDAVKLHSRRRRAVCQLLVIFYSMLESNGRYFSRDDQRRVADCGRNLVIIYSQLAAESVAKEERFWKLIPKFHIFLHLCEVQCTTWGNPRWYWCYSDEDLQKLMKAVALSCHPARMASEVLRKWVVGVFT